MGKQDSEWHKHATAVAKEQHLRNAQKAGSYLQDAKHKMGRRCFTHDYSDRGIYHITLQVAEGLGKIFGKIIGNLAIEDGKEGAPNVELSPIGKMVEYELKNTISHYYPMLEVQDYVIMPEHIHFIIEAHEQIKSRNGKKMHLGQIISGFKLGCNRQFKEILANTAQAESQAGTTNPQARSLMGATNPQAESQAGATNPQARSLIGARAQAESLIGARAQTESQAGTTNPQARSLMGARAQAESQAGATNPQARSLMGARAQAESQAGATNPQAESLIGARAQAVGDLEISSPEISLFAPGYVDVMPLKGGQLLTQREYIRNNPRQRLMRQLNSLRVERGGISTALTVSALNGYLKRVCAPSQTCEDRMKAIADMLLTTLDNMGRRVITCDSYGSRELLNKKLLPVICHRADKKLLEQQKLQCLEEAAQGTVLISACISPSEREIIQSALSAGYSVITIEDNGLTDRFHPSAERNALCASGRLLIISPWRYHYRHEEENIYVAYCKTMNCVAQAVCRCRDDWWKDREAIKLKA